MLMELTMPFWFDCSKNLNNNSNPAFSCSQNKAYFDGHLKHTTLYTSTRQNLILFHWCAYKKKNLQSPCLFCLLFSAWTSLSWQLDQANWRLYKHQLPSLVSANKNIHKQIICPKASKLTKEFPASMGTSKNVLFNHSL